MYAGWIASIATMIAAIMTAANLGVRVTGWGFVVFTLGAICWSIVGFGTGQHELLATNAFLAVVDVVGIWRWLGRERIYQDGGKAAENASKRSHAPRLFTATGVAGMPVEIRSGEALGKAVEALVECTSGQVSYVVVASGGIGGVAEQLHAVPHDQITFRCDRLIVQLDAHQFARLPKLEGSAWPDRAPEPELARA
jgi:hypothetical protein